MRHDDVMRYDDNMWWHDTARCDVVMQQVNDKNQTSKQPNNQTTKRPHNQTTKQPNNQTTKLQPNNQITKQPNNQTTKQPNNQTTTKPNNHKTTQPLLEEFTRASPDTKIRHLFHASVDQIPMVESMLWSN